MKDEKTLKTIIAIIGFAILLNLSYRLGYRDRVKVIREYYELAEPFDTLRITTKTVLIRDANNRYFHWNRH